MARTVYVRSNKNQAADQETAQRRLDYTGQGDLFGSFFQPIQNEHKGQTAKATDNAEPEIEGQLPGTQQRIGGDHKRGMIAKIGPAHNRSQDGGQHHGAKGRHGEIADHDLKGKKGPGNGRIKSRRNAARYPTARQGRQSIGRYFEQLTENRAKRGPNMDDGTFASD